MRILMTADTVGGVWTYALDLARALASRGVGVHLATLGRPLSPAQALAAAQVPNVEIHESRFKLEWMDDPWDDVAASGDWLLELEARLAPNRIHLNGYAHGALLWRAPCLVVAHSCVLSWWEAVKGEPAPESWRTYREAVSRGIRAAAAVVAPTAAMRAAVERHYGPLGRGRVIYNGRRPDGFRPRRKEPFVLAAGRLWDEAKNVLALDRVADDLPWPVRVAGEVRDADGRAFKPRHVECLGCLAPEELADCLGRAALYALPARYEPFGLSVLEAALSGCALVLGDIPSLREVWGDAALFVPPNDPSRLRAALYELMTDASRRHDLAQRARRRARRYTPTRMAQEYMSLYESMSSYSPAPTAGR